MLIDKWLDPQIRYIVNQLTKMHITVKFPNFDEMFDNERNVWQNIINDFGNIMGDGIQDINEK